MKAKRWISLLLAVSMMLGVLAMPASAAAQQPESTAVVSEALPDAAELTAAEDENDIVNIRIRATGNLVYGSGTQKEPQKNPKRTCQTGGHCCIIQTYQSKRTDAEGLLFRQERKAMTNTGRKKRRKNAVVTMAFRLFFVLLLLSMLAAYISNQVTISSKRAELETLNEQVAQQQTENQELQRVLSGDADQITEWVARDSYNYAAPNERIFVDVTGN